MGTSPNPEIKQAELPFVFPAKTANELARKQFQLQMLKEIKFDLIVCEIEGWSKTEYINELKQIINSIKI